MIKPVACGVVLPSDHALAKRKSLSPPDLKDLDYIGIKGALIGSSVIDAALESEGYSFQAKHEVSNAFAAVSLVRQGLGFMITDRFAIDPMHYPGLKLIPFKPKPVIEYAVCVTRDSREHPVKERFIEIICDLLDQDG